MTPANLLVLMSDEHNPKFLGSAGHPFIATPNLDALAARGTRFTSAYTDLPDLRAGPRQRSRSGATCTTSATGTMRTDTTARSRAGTTRCATRAIAWSRSASCISAAATGDDHGFSEEIVPMHIVDGIGDVKGLIRDRHSEAQGRRQDGAARPGRANPPYTGYDRDIASRAQIWLHEEAPKWRDRPWVLFVSFVAPHFPLTAPPRWFYRYWRQDLPLPKLYAAGERPASSVHRRLRAHGRLRSALRMRRPT